MDEEKKDTSKLEEKDEEVEETSEPTEPVELYFGYGANMSRGALNHKSMHPYRIRRGILHGWKVIFSLCNAHDQAMGNISEDSDFAMGVHGAVIELNKKDMARMDGLEFGYTRIPVKIQLYEEDGGEIVDATAYCATDESIKVLPPGNCVKEAPGEWNYRNTIVKGARELGLNKEYIEYLLSLPVTKRMDWDEEKLSKLEWYSKEYRWSEVDADPDLATIHGFVLSIAHAPGIFKERMQKIGTDITRGAASRWSLWTPDLRGQSHHDWPKELQLYVDDQSMRMLLGQMEFLCKPVGRLSKRQNNSAEFYDWHSTKYYFGFGSNLSATNLTMKGIRIQSVKRGVLPGYRFCFNIYDKHSGEGMGNITVDDSFALGLHGASIEMRALLRLSVARHCNSVVTSL